MKNFKVITAALLATLILASCETGKTPDDPESTDPNDSASVSESVSESASESASASASQSESRTDAPVVPSDPETLEDIGAKHTRVIVSSDDGYALVGLSYTDSDECTDGWVAVDGDGSIIYGDYIDVPCTIECSNIAGGSVVVRVFLENGTSKFMCYSLAEGDVLFETIEKVVSFGDIRSDMFWVAYMKGPLAGSEYYVNYYDTDGSEMFVLDGYKGGDFNSGYALYLNKSSRLAVVDEEGNITSLDASACAADFAAKYPDYVLDSATIGAFDDIIPVFGDDGSSECTFVANFVYRESADSTEVKAMAVKYTGTIATDGSVSGTPEFAE